MSHKLTLFILTSLTLLSCNLYRQRQTSLKSNEIIREETIQYRQNNYHSKLDSSRRQWTFWTDGWMYYHPDSGLRAQSGLLSLSELIYTEEQDKKVQENVHQKKEADTQVRQAEKLTTKYKTNIWLAVYMTIGLLTLLFIGTYRFAGIKKMMTK